MADIEMPSVVDGALGNSDTRDLVSSDTNDRLMENKVSNLSILTVDDDGCDAYLIDFSRCPAVNQYWLNMLNTFVISEAAGEIKSVGLGEEHKEYVADTALYIKVGEGVTLAGYMDSFVAYQLLGHYVSCVENVQLLRRRAGGTFGVASGLDVRGVRLVNL